MKFPKVKFPAACGAHGCLRMHFLDLQLLDCWLNRCYTLSVIGGNELKRFQDVPVDAHNAVGFLALFHGQDKDDLGINDDQCSRTFVLFMSM